MTGWSHRPAARAAGPPGTRSATPRGLKPYYVGPVSSPAPEQPQLRGDTRRGHGPAVGPGAYRGRFAPSPTGDLHFGALRTALLAWLHARRAGGRFLLRVEDLDPERASRAVAQRQIASLRELGLDWDEGPDVGGPRGPYVQSERRARYEEALARLATAGLTYPCFCSRAEVLLAAGAPHGPADDGPRYPGTCGSPSAGAIRARRRAGRPAALRLRVRAGTVGFDDGLLGRVSQDVAGEVGDFVVRRADGVPAYQLAVVVDDIAMGITDVVRGADLARSTPRQLLLYEALGAAPPRFTHLPLLRGPDGEKLSKRHGPVGAEALLSAGVPAGELLAELARLSGLPADGARSPYDLLAAFDLDRLPREEMRWSPSRLLATVQGPAGAGSGDRRRAGRKA